MRLKRSPLRVLQDLITTVLSVTRNCVNRKPEVIELDDRSYSRSAVFPARSGLGGKDLAPQQEPKIKP